MVDQEQASIGTDAQPLIWYGQIAHHVLKLLHFLVAVIVAAGCYHTS